MSESRFCVFDGSNYSSKPAEGIEAKVLEDLGKSTVKITHGSSNGSGFLLDLQDHVSTDAHVVLNGRRLFVETASGPLEARIEKLNVVDDVAILSVPGLSKAGVVPVKLKATETLPEGERAYSLGYPHALAETSVPCISEGSATGPLPIMDIYRRSYGDPEFLTNLDLFPLAQGEPSLPQLLLDHRDEFAQRADTITAVIVENAVSHALSNGTSGGPVGDATSSVIGMNDRVQKNSVLLATPASKIAKTYNAPSTLRFVYDSQKLLRAEPLDPSNKTASADALIANTLLEESDRF